ncbi:MAG: FAD-binding protein, partial [Actinomycetia bacterium]|nr:FAD-binding protein [Actinomycetes bacterium]
MYVKNEIIKDELKELLGVNVYFDRILAFHTTFCVGGKAKYFITADTYHQLKSSLEILDEKHIPIFILGKGSNILISDKGFNGAIIKLGRDFNNIKINETVIQAGALVSLPQIVGICHKNSLKGISFAVGIPGSLGGAIITNAGTKE